MEEAHEGMVADPSRLDSQVGCLQCHDGDTENFPAGGPRSACDGCHTETVDNTATSLHTTIAGYYTAISDRCGFDFESEVQNYPGFEARCAGCHSTCGQCHVSRPASVGGGFPQISVGYRSHRFLSKPSQSEQCTACHGSRVGTDFNGELEGVEMDVHASMGQDCMDCHTAAELHGDGNSYEHRYEVANMPRCEDCHTADVAVSVDVGSGCSECHVDGAPGNGFVFAAADVHHAHHTDTSNAACGDCHDVHGVPGPQPANMQCQACHSQPYKNCSNCHDLTDDGYTIEPSYVELKIARNPSPYRSEYDVAVVRHTPIDPDTYANWGLTLPDYLTKPTWQYTSPHNIRRQTPQTAAVAGQSCSYSCHQSPDGPGGFLLREADLRDAGGNPLVDYEANIGIVIPETFPGD